MVGGAFSHRTVKFFGIFSSSLSAIGKKKKKKQRTVKKKSVAGEWAGAAAFQCVWVSERRDVTGKIGTKAVI